MTDFLHEPEPISPADFALLCRYASSVGVTLSDMGFRRSQQAVDAGCLCLQRARSTSVCSYPGLWVPKSEMGKALAEARRLDVQAIERESLARAMLAERTRKRAEKRSVLLDRAARRLGVAESLRADFRQRLQDVPMVELGPKYDDHLREVHARVVEGVERVRVIGIVAARHALPHSVVGDAMRDFKLDPAQLGADGQLPEQAARWATEHGLRKARNRIVAQCVEPGYGAKERREMLRLFQERDEVAFWAIIDQGAPAAKAFFEAQMEARYAAEAARRAEEDVWSAAAVAFIERHSYKRTWAQSLLLTLKPTVAQLEANDPSLKAHLDAHREEKRKAKAARKAAAVESSLAMVISLLTPHGLAAMARLKATGDAALSRTLAAADWCGAIRAINRELGRPLAPTLASPPTWFPLARTLQRKVTCFFGPTNSGKTHAAMQRLAAAKTGVYLAPLRLLAYEVGDRLRAERGINTAIVTGEDRSEPTGWTHVSSTIEMMDPARRWDVAVIDEAQMLGDPDRGWAWVHALLGVAADEVIVLGAPSSEPLVRALFAQTGDLVSVNRVERLGPLRALPRALGLDAIPPHSAIVAFSRQSVLSLAEHLTSTFGRKVSVIYGALSPEVRRLEAQRFRDGETDIVVATDAIGMGLNLPVENVLFWELEKFDGVSRRGLVDAEILQIAGRAGRFGRFPIGHVGVVAGGPAGRSMTLLRRALQSTPPELRGFLPVSLTPEIAVRIGEATGIQRLEEFPWECLPLPDSPWRWSVPVDFFKTVACWPESPKASVETQARFSAAPARWPEDESFLRQAAKGIDSNQTVPLSKLATQTSSTSHEALKVLENSWRMATLYLWLAMRWPGVFIDTDAAANVRHRVDALIAALLRHQKIKVCCRTCGRSLPAGHPFPRCESCFQDSRKRGWGEYGGNDFDEY